MPTPPSASTLRTPASWKTQKACSDASARFTPRRQPCILTASASRGPCGPSTRKCVNAGERPNGVSKTRSSASTVDALVAERRGEVEADSEPLPPQMPNCAAGTFAELGMAYLLRLRGYPNRRRSGAATSLSGRLPECDPERHGAPSAERKPPWKTPCSPPSSSTRPPGCATCSRSPRSRAPARAGCSRTGENIAIMDVGDTSAMPLWPSAETRRGRDRRRGGARGDAARPDRHCGPRERTRREGPARALRQQGECRGLPRPGREPRHRS